MPVSEHHIREAVARYVLGEVGLADFAKWFAPRAWDVIGDGTSAGQMAAGIELLLAEHSSGDLSQTQLREALRQYAVGHAVTETTVELIGWTTLGAGADWGRGTLDLRQNAESPRITVGSERAA